MVFCSDDAAVVGDVYGSVCCYGWTCSVYGFGMIVMLILSVMLDNLPAGSSLLSQFGWS